MPGEKKPQKDKLSPFESNKVPLIYIWSNITILKIVVYQLLLIYKEMTFVLSISSLGVANSINKCHMLLFLLLASVYLSSFNSCLSFFPSHSVPAIMNFFLSLYSTVPLTVSEILHVLLHLSISHFSLLIAYLPSNIQISA